MAGITTRDVPAATGPSGLVRSYRPVTLNEEVPDNTMALYATAAGNATVTTMLGDTVTLPIAANGYLPIEPRLVSAWTGGNNTLFNCIR